MSYIHKPMKIILPILIAAACLPLAVAQNANPTPVVTAEGYYRQGLAAEKAGDPAAARSAYAQALRIHPNHANARFRLGELKIHAPAIAAKGREAKFGAVMVPEFRVDGASLQECLDALGIIVSKESKDEVSPNFVMQDPQNRLADAKISLSLKRVPASAVIKYLLDESKAKARFDEHAIVISPK